MREPTAHPAGRLAVTEDLVRDLLPLYFDGEASADSRAVVEAWFASRPEFARAARREAEAIGALGALGAPTLTPQETQAEIERIRRLILIREITHGLAGALTLLPFLAAAAFLLLPNRSAIPVPNLLLALAAWTVVTLTCWGLVIRSRRRARWDMLG